MAQSGRHQKESDEELFAAAMAGGPDAFAPIVERYQDAVFGIALARLRDFHDAEDVAQQAFLEAYQGLSSLKDPSRLAAWLRTIAIHRCLNHFRQRRESTGAEMLNERISSEAAPPDVAERNELRERVLAAIGRLSQTQRETTMLFYVNGYSIEEVATIQAVPSGTVKRRLHEARDRLKQEMLHMVEDVLKSEAPKEDFAGRVYALLNQYGVPVRERSDIWYRFGEAAAQLRRCCEEDSAAAMEGFARAMVSPHAFTRLVAIRTLTRLTKDQVRLNLPAVLDAVKRGLRDTNKKIRVSAVCAARELPLPNDVVRKELLPVAAELLHSPTRSSRSSAVGFFKAFPHDAPVEEILRMLIDWPKPENNRERWRLQWMKGWIREILDARAKKE